MKKSLGERLRTLRGSASQAATAGIFGVSGQSWGFYERNQKEPTLATISSICAHFGVTSDWLLGLSNTVPDLPTARAWIDATEASTLHSAPSLTRAQLLDATAALHLLPPGSGQEYFSILPTSSQRPL